MENELGNTIKGFLAAHRLTQTWLASKIGVSDVFVSGLIKGQKPLPVSAAYKIGKEFDKIHKVGNKKNPNWGALLMELHLNDAHIKKLAELAEYTKQQEQNK